MKRVTLEPSWPQSWKSSYAYDRQEIYGEVDCHGYTQSYRNRQAAAFRLLEQVLPKGSRVLDVAGAQGNFSIGLAERGYRVVWNDLRAELAEYVELKRETGDISYAPGNVFDLNFGAEFDGVLITEIIEHVAHPDEFLHKIAGMVKPGGYIVMTTPNGAYFLNYLPRFSDCPDPAAFEAVQFRPNGDGHIYLLWPDEIQRLGRVAGLTIDRQILFTNPLTAGHLKLEALLRRLPDRMIAGIERASSALPDRLAKRLMMHTAVRYRRPPTELDATPPEIRPLRAAANCGRK